MSSRPPNRVLGAPRKSQAVRKYPRDRVCGATACRTVLSIYNGAGYCSVHEQPVAAARRPEPGRVSSQGAGLLGPGSRRQSPP